MAEEEPIVKFSSKLVIASATAVSLYTGIMIWLALVNIANGTNIWPPVELTALWYGFWTTEIVALTTIKVQKVKNKYEKEETETIETTLQPDGNGNMIETKKIVKEIK